MSAPAPAVELSAVTKAFGPVPAVNQLTLTVPRGSIYGFIGPNGSGKTTTLRLILDILRPDSGSVRVLGHTPRQPHDRRIGYLPEERGLYKRMRVRPLLRFYGELRANRNVDAEIEPWLRRLDLLEHADKRVESLSKGSSQRVQFVAAVLGSPELVILDEPFGGLDPVHADALRQVILELRQQGTTVILSTHDMDVAEQLCDFVLMIFHGRKVLDGTLADIQARYRQDTLHLQTRCDLRLLATLPGVESVKDLGQQRELRLHPGANPQTTLQALVALAPVEAFRIARPSLHDIFVRIAGPTASTPPALAVPASPSPSPSSSS